MDYSSNKKFENIVERWLKMKKTLKKIGALVISTIMVMSLSAAVFADADLTGDGVVGDFTNDAVTVQDDTVLMKKEITAYNPETCTVNAPTITYNYAVSAGSADKDIYDIKTAHDPNNNVHVKTKAGVGSPVISGSVDGGTTYTAGTLVFTPDVQLNASSEGTKNSFDLKVDFSSIDFTTDGTGAGVYRYVITETCTNETKNAAGIADGGISNIRYMDVYVDGDGAVYGYVCFTNDNSIDARDGATTNTVAEAGKTEGFVATTGTGAQSADSYYTFNFEVSKDLINDAYSTTHEFPFEITLANSNVTAAVLPIMTKTGNVTQNDLAAAAIAQTWHPTIADDGVISYVGIPCGTTVTINETNDVTGVTYTSVSTGADTNAAAKLIDTGTVSNNAIIDCTTHITAATDNHTGNSKVLFTNTLSQISPTGVIIRVAPYALLLGAGVVLFVLSRRGKRKSEGEAEA